MHDNRTRPSPTRTICSSTSCSRCSSRARRGPNTTRCSSSSFTRSTSCGSRSCCTSSIASRGCCTSDEPHRAQHTLKRILTILKVLVAQLDILETMTPLEFLSFRARLEAASGFQSDQFRQIEFVLGAKNERGARAVPGGQPRPRIALERRFRDADAVGRLPSLPRAREVSGAHGAPDSRRDRGRSSRRRRSSRSCSTSTGTTRRTRSICERLVDLDEGFAEWRYRHVRMVERTIGVKPAPAARAEPPICTSTLGRNLFPDLWEIRRALVDR